MKTYTALIVPAMPDQAGQCNIVAREGDIRQALQAYRNDPSLWAREGVMNSQGQLVWCNALGDLLKQLKAYKPLRAGATFLVEVDDAPKPRDWRPWKHPRPVGC